MAAYSGVAMAGIDKRQHGSPRASRTAPLPFDRHKEDHMSVRNVVLVHGAFADGSSWSKVIPLLLAKGYRVTSVGTPLTSFAEDVAATKRAIGIQEGPVLLIGHSYGGVVITEAGNDQKAVGLISVAAFAPDKGESVSALIKDPPPGAPVPPILPPQDGYLFLDRAKFASSFAA